MRKNSFSNKGLSLSQAQSISNLCNQRALDISIILKSINNCEKKVLLGKESLVLEKGIPLPDNIIEIVLEKSKLHACQAFLMEHIKAKKTILQELRIAKPDTSHLTLPVSDKFPTSEVFPLVAEEWGWEQLSANELSRFREAEAYASHLGLFIHNRGILHNLRKNLPSVPSIEWIELTEKVKTPVKILVHHTPEQLSELHEQLAKLHREYEQKVNYFKSKVKNLVNEENARISKVNALEFQRISRIKEEIINKNNKQRVLYSEKVNEIIELFEIKRQKEINKVSSLRIEINPIFQDVIDMFLVKE